MPERRAARRHRAARARRRRRGSAGLALLVAGVLVGVLASGPGTWAWWNDVATAEGQTFSSGTLDLRIGDGADVDSYSWAALALADLAPGESKAAALTVSNAGTTPFTITTTGGGEGTLLSYLSVTVVLGGTATNTGTAYPRTGACTGGTQTFAGALSTTPVSVVASSPTVAPGGSTTLCVRVALPATASNDAQGASATTTFAVTATQVIP